MNYINNQKKPTAVLYARVSSKEQEEGYSIPAQLKLLRDYAVMKGLKVVQEYTDVETAKRAGRSSFTSMVNFLKKESKAVSPDQACRALLVEKTDRLYRNFKDAVILEDLDLEIHFVKENQVFSHESRSSEKLFHDFKVALAKNYIENLSEETKKGMIEKAKQGIYPSYAPYGYINVECNGKRCIQPDPERVMLVQQLYKSYATGTYSLLELTKKAHEEGLVYRRTGTKVGKSMVHKILTNPIYYGEFVWAFQCNVGDGMEIKITSPSSVRSRPIFPIFTLSKNAF